MSFIFILFVFARDLGSPKIVGQIRGVFSFGQGLPWTPGDVCHPNFKVVPAPLPTSGSRGGGHRGHVPLLNAELARPNYILASPKPASRRGFRGGGGSGSGARPWDGGTRAEGAVSFVSRAERRDTGVP